MIFIQIRKSEMYYPKNYLFGQGIAWFLRPRENQKMYTGLILRKKDGGNAGSLICGENGYGHLLMTEILRIVIMLVIMIQ
ncbi:MAG: hypothetical protein C6W57_03315 [Caldibacillus debilis]|nr:MAG: hypothetical protein C6W57_03315 [Caldibacillus debilis]